MDLLGLLGPAVGVQKQDVEAGLAFIRDLDARLRHVEFHVCPGEACAARRAGPAEGPQ